VAEPLRGSWSLERLSRALAHARGARLGSGEAAARLREALAELGLAPAGDGPAELEAQLEEALASPRFRLAVYGTLAPGERNHHLLQGLPGEWSAGTVEGFRAVLPDGLPAFEWRPGAPPVPIAVFTSPLLPSAWPRLDSFEGADYPRILVPVARPDGSALACNLYERRGWRGG
jgi:gamma-glutamylcyclotransferase (GGCT)/AIG2-like uncharacterized protein YtfP